MFESILLAHIYLNPRRHCSLVSGRWLLVEGVSRYRLDLNSQSDLLPLIQSIFQQLDSQQPQYNQLSCIVPPKSSSENGRIPFPMSPHTLTLC
ncbi:unnamed protein product [Lactuca virosa]|uniref:Uncharacterized protein n=1 Tax=Lactuca virosa TaxID=75947 RepID=A0AAU9LD09_9ASTR|nr:unnamed protein product [Lactuca virosa]